MFFWYIFWRIISSLEKPSKHSMMIIIYKLYASYYMYMILIQINFHTILWHTKSISYRRNRKIPSVNLYRYKVCFSQCDWLTVLCLIGVPPVRLPGDWQEGRVPHQLVHPPVCPHPQADCPCPRPLWWEEKSGVCLYPLYI